MYHFTTSFLAQQYLARACGTVADVIFGCKIIMP